MVNVAMDREENHELIVDISDALSEREKVKYTVHTKTTMPEFTKQEISVVREHEEFIWLHNCLEDNEASAGFIVSLERAGGGAFDVYNNGTEFGGGLKIPPAPPRPDFDASREKLQKLGEGESTMTKEEFQ